MRGRRLFHGAYLFVAGAFSGALLAFALGAGLVLKAAPSRHVGGAVNRALLDALDVLSYGAVGLLLLLFLALRRQEGWSRMARALTVRLLLVVGVATVASHLLVTPEMMSLRDRMATVIDLVPKDDPLRREWGRLHGLSSMLLLVRLLGAAGLFAFGVASMPETTYVVRPREEDPVDPSLQS